MATFAFSSKIFARSSFFSCKVGVVTYYRDMKNTLKHAGSCDKTCGHALDNMTVPYNQAVQRLLDRDPRVVEYSEDGEWLHVVYAYRRPVAAIYRASAAQLGIQELA